MDSKVRYIKREMHNITFKALHLAVLFLLFSSNQFAQILFDVKTTMQEKQQLHVIKIAVINALKQSNWANVVEYREDYSLWLTNLHRYNNYNSFRTEIDLDLRTPAMLTTGKHITGLRVSVTFDTIEISNIPVSSDTLMTSFLIQGLRNSGELTEFTALLSGGNPILAYLVSSFINDVFREMKRQPTPMESYEANLLAAKAVIELKKLFR